MPISHSKLPRFFFALTLIVCAIGFYAGSAFSHTSLGSPNGGESLTPGQTVEVQWFVTAAHSTVGWNLEYSLNGSTGPWLPIVTGLPAGNTFSGSSHSYFWTVPILNSDSVRIRVTMVNSGQNYMDTSDSDFGIGDTLGADVFTLSIQNGGTQNLTLDVGPNFAFNVYVVAGSASGSQPGFDVEGFHVPLNNDFYLTATLESTSLSPLTNSIGALNASGVAQAQVVLPALALPPSLAGFVLHHAAAVIGFDGSFGLVTNAEPVTLVP